MTDHLKDRYDLLERISTLPHGNIWKAKRKRGGQASVVSVLSSEGTAAEALRARFREDAEVLKGLRHMALARILDVGETEDGEVWVAAQVPAGQTLAARLAEGPALHIRDLLRVAASILDALKTAHGAGIVHGDIEPTKIWLPATGGAKLMGFALNRSLVRSGKIDESPGEDLRFSLAYMAPEQAAGKPATAASDLHSIGAVLYDCLAGRLPRSGADEGDLRAAIMDDPALPLAEARPEITDPLASNVDRSLSAAPEQRYDDASSMRKALMSSLIVAPALARLELPVGKRGILSQPRSSSSDGDEGTFPEYVDDSQTVVTDRSEIDAVAEGLSAASLVRDDSLPPPASGQAVAVGNGGESVRPTAEDEALDQDEERLTEERLTEERLTRERTTEARPDEERESEERLTDMRLSASDLLEGEDAEELLSSDDLIEEADLFDADDEPTRVRDLGPSLPPPVPVGIPSQPAPAAPPPAAARPPARDAIPDSPPAPEPISAPRQASDPGPASDPAPAQPAAQKKPVALIALAAAALLIGGYFAFGGRDEEPSAAEISPPTEPAPPPTEPSEPPEREFITVALSGIPEGAIVLLDGEETRVVPLTLPRGDANHTIVVQAEGYETVTREVLASEDQELSIRMTREPSTRDRGRRTTMRAAQTPPESESAMTSTSATTMSTAPATMDTAPATMRTAPATMDTGLITDPGF